MCNRNINSAAGSFVVVIILYFNDSFRIGSFFTDFMKRADAGSIGTGVDNTILIDEINIVIIGIPPACMIRLKDHIQKSSYLRL